MASIKLTNVKKIYDKNVVAVHGFNLDIKDKEFVVFVGPSGCGKSTTLRMIAGLEEISEGTIEIGGRVVNDLQPKDRDIAMVFQNYALYPHMTVFENMAFPLRLKKVPHEEVYKRVTEAAEILGITDYLTRRPRALSGGQRQRVAIGRAMVRDSQVLLMDEPLSNLDAKLRNQMRAEIIMLRKKIDTTFVYVTHDQTEAMTLGDRIVIMKDGYIQQVGTPNEVFEMPDNLFVAEFIGAPKMNTFRTQLVREGKKYYVTPFGVKMPVDGEKAEALLARDVQSQEIILGIRPEHILLTNRNNPAAVLCTVQVNEMMGSELHLHVVAESGEKLTEGEELAAGEELATGEELIIRVPTVDLSANQRAALVSGAKILVTFPAKVMHFFDIEKQWNLLCAETIKVDANTTALTSTKNLVTLTPNVSVPVVEEASTAPDTSDANTTALTPEASVPVVEEASTTPDTSDANTTVFVPEASVSVVETVSTASDDAQKAFNHILVTDTDDIGWSIKAGNKSKGIIVKMYVAVGDSNGSFEEETITWTDSTGSDHSVQTSTNATAHAITLKINENETAILNGVSGRRIYIMGVELATTTETFATPSN